MTSSQQVQGDTILEWVGLSRRHFLTVASATVAGAFGIGATGVASADAGSGTGTFTGSLSPDSGGSFAKYTIDKPTGAKITVSLVYGPFDAGQAHRVGFALWQGGSKIYHGNGHATGLKDHTNSNVVTKTVTPKAGEALLIKVFNYGTKTVSFTVTVAGAKAAAATTKGVARPAFVEYKGSETGTLEGVGGATTMNYTITKPTGSKITVSMAYGPFDAGEAHRVGFSVWQNGKRILRKTGKATGFKDHTNSSDPSGSVTPAANEPLLIKVFNLNTLAPITYRLTVK
ncbi:MAG: hypothetical protein ACR2JY_20435 [Chloroflexota bacterium]